MHLPTLCMDRVLPKLLFATPSFAATSPCLEEVALTSGHFAWKSARRNLGDPNEPSVFKFSVDFVVFKVVVSFEEVFVSFEEARCEAGEPGVCLEERFSVETVLELLLVSFVSSISTVVSIGDGQLLLSAFSSLLETLVIGPESCVSVCKTDLPSGCFVLSLAAADSTANCSNS